MRSDFRGMTMLMKRLVLAAVLFGVAGCSDNNPAAPPGPDAQPPQDGQPPRDLTSPYKDMLTPGYYQAGAFKAEIDAFLGAVRQVRFGHPLKDTAGQVPSFSVPAMGNFGAGKGPTGTSQHHPAVDMHVANKATKVTLYAAHDGLVATYKNADKYRHYVSITREIKDAGGKAVGKLVTLYAHVDLDLDEAAALSLNGKKISSGEVVSRNLYAGTVGGAHLHFEVRYYRPADAGTESFYGLGSNKAFTEKSAGGWSYGFWDPAAGYGYADTKNHGLNLH